MRTGTRNWLFVLLIVAGVIFFLGWLSNRQDTVSAATVQRTELEQSVDAFTKYTQAQVDRFERFQAAVSQSQWDEFWATLVRIAIYGSVFLAGWFALKLLPVLIARVSIVKTSRGDVLLRKGNDGQFIPVPMDKPFEEPVAQRQASEIPVTHNGVTQTIEVSREGKVISVTEDAADFLEKAIKVNGSHAKELPRHESMGVSAERWSAMVHEWLGGMFKVENRGDGVRTYCAAYPDLGTTYYAVINKKVPLPEKKKTKK